MCLTNSVQEVYFLGIFTIDAKLHTQLTIHNHIRRRCHLCGTDSRKTHAVLAYQIFSDLYFQMAAVYVVKVANGRRSQVADSHLGWA